MNDSYMSQYKVIIFHNFSSLSCCLGEEHLLSYLLSPSRNILHVDRFLIHFLSVSFMCQSLLEKYNYRLICQSHFFLRSPVMFAHLKVPGKAVKSPSSWFLLTLNFPKRLYFINKLHYSLVLSALLISSLILGGLQKWWPYLFCKGQDCKYCKVDGLHGLCHNYSTVPF